MDRVIQTTDDTNSQTIDVTVLDAVIAAAEAEFDLYAGVYYVTPVRTAGDEVPIGVKEKLVDAVAWHLMNRRPEVMRSSADEGEYWTRRRREILGWFEAIASADPKRRLLIPGATEKSEDDVAPRAGSAKVTSDVARFSTARMKRFF